MIWRTVDIGDYQLDEVGKSYWAPDGSPIVDWQLRRIFERAQASQATYDAAVRDAFLMLEERIRNAAGLRHDSYGSDLIKAAFNPSSGLLVNPDTVGAERKGVHDLFMGAFLTYRNPAAHRFLNHDESAARRIFNLLDLLLDSLEKTVENQLDVQRYVSRHEGNIGHYRRFYRLDIDDDDVEERVVLMDTGSVVRRDGTFTAGTLITLVLKPDGDDYRRIPSEPLTDAFSMYGPVSVELMNITNPLRKDLVVQWTFGEAQTGYFVLKWATDQYVLVRRDSDSYLEPYASFGDRGFMTHPTWQGVQFVDFDGDGLKEVIHFLGHDSSNPDGTGWSQDIKHNVNQICRVFKYDASYDRFCLADEVGITS